MTPAALPVALAVLLAADLSWITYARPMYAALVRNVQGGTTPMRVDRVAAAVAYVFVVATFVLLVAATPGTTVARAFGKGAMVGFLVYGVFNATNKAMFQAYDARTAVVDTLWGTTVFGLAAATYHLVATRTAA